MNRAEMAFWLAVALVIGIFFFSADVGGSEWGGLDPASLYYNALARGFGDGQLSLKKEVPAALANLSDPYNPAANASYLYAPYQLNDLSYFHGKFYLYFGVTPALLLFWPWLAVTGHPLLHKYAVAIFCAAGFLLYAGLWRGLWRRCFPEVSVWVATAGALALGLATSLPVLLQRPGVSEVPIGCAYALTALALAAIWRALHDARRAIRWTAVAGVAYGLALGARPSELLGAAILLAPAILAARSRRGTPAAGGDGAGSRPWPLLAAAAVPLALCGAGLLLYNYLRFGAPLEFGQRYQLAGERQDLVRHFSPGYLGYNLRVYFLAPMQWSHFFPFVESMLPPPPPAGHAAQENLLSILFNIPLVGVAAAAPLAWRGRPEAVRLRGFLLTVGALFLLLLPPLLFYYWSSNRYEAEFLPPLVFLAMVGILGLERTLAGNRSGLRLARLGWISLLVFSVGCNLLAGFGRYAAERYQEGETLLATNRADEAIAQFEKGLRFDPGSARAHLVLGEILGQQGRAPEAVAHDREAVRIAPDSAIAHQLLAGVLAATGKLPEAVEQYRTSLRLDPHQPVVCDNLGIALGQLGRFPEAIAQFEAALRLKPNDVESRVNLGTTFFLAGRVPEAVTQFEAALRLSPHDPALLERLHQARQALHPLAVP
jgi:tetratricopeptide (TPR) repeat protein